MFDDILIPTDGSDEADVAVDHGIELAKKYDATVRVLHVVNLVALGRVSDVQPAKDAGRGIVATVGDRVEDNEVPLETDVRSGIPHVEILKYASQNDVDLIAMGRQGQGRLEDFLIGSVTTNVVREADVPVLTVRMADNGELYCPYENILVPTDGSQTATNAADTAIELTDRYDATLHILSVIDTQPLGFDVRSEVAQDELEEDSETAIDEIEAQAQKGGLSAVRTSVEHGRPHQTIRTYVAENEIDLVVMGTHGRTAVDRLFLGSVTKRVLQTVPVPVVTVQTLEDTQ
ncbi:universal stress protein [Halorussus salinisoli]|uniref:universal stress protein n=1 Tax=Halorussus salinisoli TaxID=2558242 RepID=UPI0010C1D4CE|nr:universal stress protein [Halorussus salinisoli]